MASSPVNLTMSHPCAQPWQTMVPDQQGRFCTHCQKSVVDFTAMTDAQLLASLNTAAGASGCGRFRADQLNRVLTAPAAGKPGRWQWLGVLLSGWLSSQTVQAQTETVTSKRVGATFIPALAVFQDKPALADIDTQGWQPEGTLILKGRVIDTDSRQPIRGATVAIKNTPYKTTTDTAGTFRLVGTGLHPDSTLQLVAGSIAYVNRVLAVDIYLAGQPLLIELREDTVALNEVVYTGGYITQKPTLWRRIGNWFKR